MVAGFALTRQVREPLQFGLELWTGAGLLRLVGDVGWVAIAGAAAVVAVRMVAARTLLSPR